MADNTTLNPGVGGDVVAADDVGGVKYQVVKLDLGGDGVSSPVSGALPVSGTFYQDTQPVSAAALPLPTGAATDATLAALQTLLTSLVGTIYSQNAVFIDGSPGQLIPPAVASVTPAARVIRTSCCVNRPCYCIISEPAAV